MGAPTFFRRATMAALAARSAGLGIVHVTSLAEATVPLPPLNAGVPFLERWPLHEEPGGAHWRDTAYAAPTPWVFVLPDAILHSEAGIVCVGGFAVEETLAHTDPVRHRYRPDADGVWIDVADAAALPGAHISVLHGSGQSYYHALLDGLGRLAPVPADVLAGADGLLTLPDPPPPVAWLQARLGERWSLRRTAAVGSLRVAQLVLAGQADTACRHHPCLLRWSAALDAFTAGEPPGRLRRFYLDRSGAAGRRLENEAAVVAALAPLGIEPVAPEFLSPPAQIALFRHAELVVAPHGAGLAGLLFANPACRVVELQMDAYCHWGYRRLAALKGLPYDCVLGRLQGAWPTRLDALHGARWRVSVPHVVAAVVAMAARPAP